jgi:hypothetical protein
MYCFAHDYDLVITECQKALELDPAFEVANGELFAAYSHKGMYKEAVEQSLPALFSRLKRQALANCIREIWLVSSSARRPSTGKESGPALMEQRKLYEVGRQETCAGVVGEGLRKA